MSITREKIIELASRYILVDITDFPEKGDLFFFLVRKLPDNKVLNRSPRTLVMEDVFSTDVALSPPL